MWGPRGVLKPRSSSPAPGLRAPHPLTIRFTMIILGPSVLLMVNMCISRRQNMMKSRESTMRPGYSSAGISLARGRGRQLSSLLPGPVPGHRLPCPSPRVAPGGKELWPLLGPDTLKTGCKLKGRDSGGGWGEHSPESSRSLASGR